MIDRISGTVQSVYEASISINIGSISFQLQVANPLAFKVNQKISLLVHMHWNQEQGPSLFGFETELEKQIFLLVIGCAGIGPKIGLAVLRDLGPDQFIEAVHMNEEKVLSKVGGLGSKKVEQMVVQLRRKIEKLIKSGVELKGATRFADWQKVSEALSSLNYSRAEIAQAMHFLSEQHASPASTFDVLIRQALSFLAKKR